jgi:hypothetical protein
VLQYPAIPQTRNDCAAKSESAVDAATLLRCGASSFCHHRQSATLQHKPLLRPCLGLQAKADQLKFRKFRKMAHLSGQMKPAQRRSKASVAVCTLDF